MIEERLKEESLKEYNQTKKIKLVEDNDSNNLVCDLNNYPHAFILACAMDRQIDANRAWAIPYKIKKIVGDFSIKTLSKISQTEYTKIFNDYSLHRFNDKMALIFYETVQKIMIDYNGDASKIWSDTPSSATVISRLLDFNGIGIKIATMGANILSRDFKIPFSDYYSIDISPDVHVKRVFKRMGLVDDPNNIDKLIYKARSINPEFPGLLDLTCWKLGRDICRPTTPKCDICIFKDVCPKILDN